MMKVLAVTSDGYRSWVGLEFFLKGKFRPVIMKWAGTNPVCPISFK